MYNRFTRITGLYSSAAIWGAREMGKEAWKKTKADTFGDH